MEKNHQNQLLRYTAGRRQVSVPCIALCAVFVLIVGFLPLLPRSFTIFLRPAAILTCFVFADKVRYRMSYASKALLLFMGYITAILLAHDLTSSALTDYISMLLFAFFFIIETEHVWTRREIRVIFVATALAGLCCSVVLLNENESLRTMAGKTELQFFGNLKNRNTMGFSIVPSVLCSTVLLFNDRKRKLPILRISYLASLIVCGYTVIATGARSAALSMMIGVLLIVLEFTNRSGDAKNRLLRRIFVAVLAVLAVYALINFTDGTESARIFKDLDNKSGREDLWEFSRQLIRKKPVFGGGFDYWRDMDGSSLGTHNTYYTIMVVSGYVGAFFLTVFLGAVLMELLSIHSLIPVAFVVELISHTYSESSMDYYAYIPLILAYMLYHYSKNQKRPIRTIFQELPVSGGR